MRPCRRAGGEGEALATEESPSSSSSRAARRGRLHLPCRRVPLVWALLFALAEFRRRAGGAGRAPGSDAGRLVVVLGGGGGVWGRREGRDRTSKKKRAKSLPPRVTQRRGRQIY